MSSENGSKAMLAKKFALGFGIAVLFPFMVHYGVTTFSPQPNWEDYQVRPIKTPYVQVSEEDQAKWQAEFEQKEAQRKADQARFQKHLFYVAAPAGVIAIVAGAFIGIQAIGSGLMFGGIFCLIDGYANYWSELPNVLRFISLLTAFIVLMVIGFKKFKQ